MDQNQVVQQDSKDEQHGSSLNSNIKVTKIKRSSEGLFEAARGPNTTIERMVYLYTKYGEIRVRLAKDRNNLMYRNSVSVGIEKNRNIYQGALIRKYISTTEFGLQQLSDQVVKDECAEIPVSSHLSEKLSLKC